MKKNLKNLYEYMQLICNYWDHPHYITLQVLIQNMYFEGKLKKDGINIINKMGEIHNADHVVLHIMSELNFLEIGERMSHEQD